MTLAGKHQYEIASLLGVHQGTVSRDLARARKQWAEQYQEAAAQLVVRGIAELESDRRAALEKWHESQRIERKTRTRMTSGVVDAKGKPADVIEEVEESSHCVGDPRFLDLAMKATIAILRTAGAEKPIKHALTDTDGNNIPIQFIRYAIMPGRDSVEEPEADGAAE